MNKPAVINYSRHKFNNKRYTNQLSYRDKKKIYSVENGKFAKNKADERGKVPVCYRCKKPGHVIANCRMKFFDNKINDKRVSKHALFTEEINIGNYKENGSLNNKNKKDSATEYVYVCSTGNLLRVEGLVNGYQVKLAIDSGCTTSIISRSVALKYKLNILPSNSKIKTADNNVSDVVGKTELLNIDIAGHVCNSIIR